MQSLQIPSIRRGFTIIEALLTIVIIGSIAAITIPQLGNYREQASDNAAKRTAQVIASTAEIARVAGDMSISGAPDKGTAIDLLAEGVKGSGEFSEAEYKVAFKPDERDAILRYLDFQRGILMYDATGLEDSQGQPN